MFVAFFGCSDQHVNAPTFVSTKTNKAYEVAPDLCPQGKYGFDPRCRGWYDTGRHLYFEHRRPIHITAPYRFAFGQTSASTATAAVANPWNDEYVGQMLLDFYPAAISDTIDDIETSMAFIITPSSASEGDVVAGFGNSKVWEPAWLIDELFPYESKTSNNRAVFEREFLPEVKSDVNGTIDFVRFAQDGSEEDLTLVHFPVFARTLLPLNPSDFARGVQVTRTHVYTVGLVSRRERLRTAWESISQDVRRDIKWISVVYVMTVVVSSSLMLFLAVKVSTMCVAPVSLISS